MSVKTKTTHHLKVTNFELSYKIEGNGAPAFVIGSATYDSRTFSQNLRDSLQMIFLDTRVFGAATSAVMEESFTVTHLIEDIECLRKTLKLEKIILIGHSIHALVALEYAKKYPESVSHLVLTATSPIVGAPLHKAADRYFEESVCPERKAALTKNLSIMSTEIENTPDSAFVTRLLKFTPMLWYNFAYDAAPLWKGVTVNSLGASIVWGPLFINYVIEHNLNQLQCPLFLALGRYDYWNPPYLWEDVRSKCADLTIRVFEKSGHTPQLEEAQSFDSELLHWLQSHPLANSSSKKRTFDTIRVTTKDQK